MSKDTSGPAFPVLHQNEITGYVPPETSGMTLRDYFAAKALEGMLSENGGGAITNDELATWAYQIADAMLKARQE